MLVNLVKFQVMKISYFLPSFWSIFIHLQGIVSVTYYLTFWFLISFTQNTNSSDTQKSFNFNKCQNRLISDTFQCLVAYLLLSCDVFQVSSFIQSEKLSDCSYIQVFDLEYKFFPEIFSPSLWRVKDVNY